MSMLVTILSLVAFSVAGAATAQTTRAPPDGSPSHVLIRPDALHWQPLPRTWADGPPPAGYDLGHTEVTIIQGDPTKEGEPFVMRIRSDAGTPLPPHWHETDEYITVISGIWCAGIGERFDDKTCQDMPAGSFVFIPKGQRHFAIAKGDVVQIHGIGPFRINWVK